MKKIFIVLALFLVGTGAMCQEKRTEKKKVTKEETTTSSESESFKPSENSSETYVPTLDTKHEYETYNYQVLDRWGKTIFESTDPNAGWDGKIDGNLAPEGTYVWIINYTESGSTQKHRHTGHVTVLK